MSFSEIIFEVTEADEGGYNARALGHSIFTQGDDWADLKEMVKDATRCHFDDEAVFSGQFLVNGEGQFLVVSF